jgi:formylmethanofuran dehydrogenase subunit E
MPIANSQQFVCGRPIDECLKIIEGFHNWMAPGLVLGLFMVDKAKRLIGDKIEFDAIVETRHCLPDAIQLFTPCTYGNGWMKIIDWDKFALTLYDRYTLKGYRVWLDIYKSKAHPDLYNWYQRLVSKKELPLDTLINTILDAKDSVLSSTQVEMTQSYRREKKGETRVCPRCGEAYGAQQGLMCATCAGGSYYRETQPCQRSIPVADDQERWLSCIKQ